MKIEFFSTIEDLKADRVPRKYSKEELIAQKNAARAINKIRVENLNHVNHQNF
ncbi:MAG: hypothetical protein HRT61_11870 [Ekhidna sp.]|nr:hypothetical protein [Ekhidna sp.]